MEGVVPVGSSTIRAINKSVVHRICSGQVILDLSSAVKELVENSLDAGASSIEIALKEYGMEWFKVIDNGCGISPKNFQVLALKHHTSKIADFPDLQSLTTFGFRGEALSSLCALGNLTVETRTKNEPVATHLTFDHSGVLASERKTARQIGTTVTVEKLFSTLPVRIKEFSRNIRREYGKLISLLNAYALIAKGVRLVCSNTTGKNIKSMVLKTQGSGFLKDNIITLFGMNTFTCLEPLSICISDNCKVEGFLSKPGHGSGRNLGDRQFFFVNGRPVDMPKVSKLVNELYKGANSRQYPIAVMNFTIPTRAYDVNVTPDKRKIFFSDEGSLLHSLREAIEKVYSPNQCSYSVNRFEEPKKEADRSELYLPHEEACLSLEQVSPEGCDPKLSEPSGDQIMEEQIAEDEIPLKRIKKGIDDSYIREGMIHKKDENPVGKDFSLRVHSVEKASSFSGSRTKQLKIPIPSAAIDKHAPSPSRITEKNTVENKHASSHSSHVQSLLTKFVTEYKRKHEDGCTVLSEMPILRNEITRCQATKTNSEMHVAVPKSLVSHQHVDDSSEVNANEPFKYFRASDVSNEAGTPLSSGGNINHGGPGEEDCENQEKSLPLADVASASFRNDLEKISEDLSDAAPLLQCSNVTPDTPVPSSGIGMCSTLQFSFEDLRTRRQQRLSRMQSRSFTYERMKIKRCYTAATLELSQPENDERKTRALTAATTELERFFKKEDFGRMQLGKLVPFSPLLLSFLLIVKCFISSDYGLSKSSNHVILETLASKIEFVIPRVVLSKKNVPQVLHSELDKVVGQFNLGFIIGKLDQDLFIVDQAIFLYFQHAADEKYNFERLSQSTVLNQQPLLQPLRLDLSPEEEVVASMHMDIIRKNGFTMEEDAHAPPGHHFKLKSVPFSKNITFGAEGKCYVKELISTLADSQGECSMIGSYKMDSPGSVCPSRVRAMLASRACRSSVMIGDPLGRNEMQKVRILHVFDVFLLIVYCFGCSLIRILHPEILEHLTDLKSPWNCPHGRPTMRHLIDLTTIRKTQDENDTDL
ncbi:hypothetical protein HHK36_026508 [Tetracentron sinense]|uniref:Uncharacterized protein n=1 Tax=Tetracentron sinense TaxID=13715 RepID=A0A834YLI0_TETSI|nr:hypothetical protein HHK36_026508 [Tetracentron sinense]